MDTFTRKNKYGIDFDYGIIATTKENGKEYVIYTDFVYDETEDLRLFAAQIVGEEFVPIDKETEEKILDKFRNNSYDSEEDEVKFEDFSFTTIDKSGNEVINDITKIIPNNKDKDSPYVVFTDYSLNEKDEFIEQYGKLIQQDDNFSIETNLTPLEISYIKEMQEDEIVKYVNNALEENLYGE